VSGYVIRRKAIGDDGLYTYARRDHGIGVEVCSVLADAKRWATRAQAKAQLRRWGWGARDFVLSIETAERDEREARGSRT